MRKLVLKAKESVPKKTTVWEDPDDKFNNPIVATDLGLNEPLLMTVEEFEERNVQLAALSATESTQHESTQEAAHGKNEVKQPVDIPVENKETRWIKPDPPPAENTERRWIRVKKRSKEESHTTVREVEDDDAKRERRMRWKTLPEEFPVMMPVIDSLTVEELKTIVHHHQKNAPVVDRFVKNLPKFLKEGKFGPKIGV